MQFQSCLGRWQRKVSKNKFNLPKKASLYDPLEKRNLAQSIVNALLSTDLRSLGSVPDMLLGAGVYAIYYSGPLTFYEPVSKLNGNGQFRMPVYVGKAIPKGGRKGGLSLDASSGHALRDRLRQHADNIRSAENLEIADFHFRSLVVDDVWIPLGENMLIEEYSPVWNVLIDGFGNKTPGALRVSQKRSAWDVIHPGRPFAAKLGTGKFSSEYYLELLANFFAESEKFR